MKRLLRKHKDIPLGGGSWSKNFFSSSGGLKSSAFLQFEDPGLPLSGVKSQNYQEFKGFEIQVKRPG